MCEGCWEAYGSPTIVNEKVLNAVDLIRAVYERHSAGGNCHVVLDDWNIEDHWVRESVKDIAENPGGDDAEEIAASAACMAAFAEMTLEERASALAIRDGYFVPEGMEDPRGPRDINFSEIKEIPIDDCGGEGDLSAYLPLPEDPGFRVEVDEEKKTLKVFRNTREGETK